MPGNRKSGTPQRVVATPPEEPSSVSPDQHPYDPLVEHNEPSPPLPVRVRGSPPPELNTPKKVTPTKVSKVISPDYVKSILGPSITSTTGSAPRSQKKEKETSHTDEEFSINKCRHLIGRGTQQERESAKWAIRLRDGVDEGPAFNTSCKVKPDLKSGANFEVVRGHSRDRLENVKGNNSIRSQSMDAVQTLGKGQTPLRFLIEASDKWTPETSYHWAVPPTERMQTLCRRCHLLEPSRLDESFKGYIVTIPSKNKIWKSSTDQNITVSQFGFGNGDVGKISTNWTQHRSRKNFQ